MRDFIRRTAGLLVFVGSLMLLAPVVSVVKGQYELGIAGLSSSGSTITSTLPILLPDGSSTAPSLAFSSQTGTGLFYTATGTVNISNSGTRSFVFNPQGLSLLSDSIPLRFGAATDLILVREAAAALQLGADAATATAQTITAADSTGAGNTGASLTLSGGSGGAGGAQGAVIISGPSLQGTSSKAVVDATPTAFATLTVADDDYEACAIGWTAYAEDADTDARQVRHGITQIAVLNSSGTESCGFSTDGTANMAVNVTAGTLTCAFTCTAGTNLVTVNANCDTSLNAAAETLTFEYRFDCESTTTITAQ